MHNIGINQHSNFFALVAAMAEPNYMYIYIYYTIYRYYIDTFHIVLFAVEVCMLFTFLLCSVFFCHVHHRLESVEITAFRS